MTRLAARVLGHARRLAGSQAHPDYVAPAYIRMAAESESFEDQFVSVTHRETVIVRARMLQALMRDDAAELQALAQKLQKESPTP